MARSSYAWGIDIGKCALKALRCRISPTDPRQLVAEGFDYIEYPMLLTQPDADPVELVQNALREFKSRNSLRGDRVAVAVPGQSGLSKFIKLPPIEMKKIPDIVRYEARQQIPFPLEQVIWDWQRLDSAVEEGGFVMDAEVALFAIKKEQVAKMMAPLTEAGIEVDVLQLAPISLANMAMFDQLPDPKTVDPEKLPASIVIVSTGVNSTDLVVTNGFKIWQRSMPIGGSTFTDALVKQMKLTFAKAEHLKRNVVRAEDPKAVFQAMRPVFGEFAGELQRSLNYFTGSDRHATIGKVLLLGNAAKLRGLSDYVAKQLQLEVHKLDKFEHLAGEAVLSAPAFRENRLAFGTAYGLALQAAAAAPVRTNLLPKEIVRDRIVESKKPWAVGALVGLLLAAVLNFAGMYVAWTSYTPKLFAGAFQQADGVKTRSQQAVAELDEVRKKRDDAVAQQQSLVQVQERRFQTLDMIRAVESLLPRDKGAAKENLSDRNELHITSLDCQYFADLATWFAAIKPMWDATHSIDVGGAAPVVQPPADPAQAATDPAQPPGDGAAPVAGPTGPSGPGWVVQLTGYHYHNEEQGNEGEQFVRSTLIRGLLGKGEKVLVSAGKLAGQLVPVADLGIGYPVIVSSSTLERVALSPDELAGRGKSQDSNPATGSAQPAQTVELTKYSFVIQFAWQPVVPGAPKPAAAAAAAVGPPMPTND
jgi:type IV pilus assembly protein PilM